MAEKKNLFFFLSFLCNECPDLTSQGDEEMTGVCLTAIYDILMTGMSVSSSKSKNKTFKSLMLLLLIQCFGCHCGTMTDRFSPTLG